MLDTLLVLVSLPSGMALDVVLGGEADDDEVCERLEEAAALEPPRRILTVVLAWSLYISVAEIITLIVEASSGGIPFSANVELSKLSQEGTSAVIDVS